MENYAYSSEPKPLKMKYPGDGLNPVVFVINMISFFLFLQAYELLRWPFIINGDFVGSIITALQMLIYVLAGYAVGLMSIRVEGYLRESGWKKAFQANNADLNLNYDAIDKVMEQMRKDKYNEPVIFKLTVIYLAIELRFIRDKREGYQTLYGEEVVKNYLFFANGIGSPVEPRYPK